MSGKELRRMFNRASRFCEAHFARRGEIAPMWHAVTSEGENIIEPHPGYLAKDLAMVMIRAFFDAKDVVRYVYIGDPPRQRVRRISVPRPTWRSWRLWGIYVRRVARMGPFAIDFRRFR
jgi:hypothetical protein